MSLAIALGHHRANRSLRTSTNLNFIQPKLFGAARQDDHRISDCTVFVIQILGAADVAFRVFGAELRTVLSATTMLADTLHRLSGDLSRSDVVLWRVTGGGFPSPWPPKLAL